MPLPTIRCAGHAREIGVLLTTVVVVLALITGETRADASAATTAQLGADQFVVVFDRAAKGRERLYAVRADGNAPRTLAKSFSAARIVSKEWSHDRSMLAFQSSGRGSPLWVINANGSGRRLLARDAADFTWSPDDKRLVFVEDDRSDPWLNVIDVDGSARRSLTPGQGPEWSADGRIYFVRGGVPGWPNGTFSINPDAGDERPFPIGFESGFIPSPDGRQIAFSSYSRDGRLHAGLYVVGADGTGLRELTPLSTQGIAWAPGGDRVAFVTNDSRTPGGSFFALGVVNADGTGLRYLARLRCCGSLFSWAPDGTRIAFDAAYTPPKGGLPGRADVLVINANGGRASRITRRLRPRGDNTDPNWVPASLLR